MKEVARSEKKTKIFIYKSKADMMSHISVMTGFGWTCTDSGKGEIRSDDVSVEYAAKFIKEAPRGLFEDLSVRWVKVKAI